MAYSFSTFVNSSSAGFRDIKIYNNCVFVQNYYSPPYVLGYDLSGTQVYSNSSSDISGIICLALSDEYIYGGAYPTVRTIYQIHRITGTVVTVTLPNTYSSTNITSLSYSNTTDRLYLAAYLGGSVLYYYDVSVPLTTSSQPVFAYTLPYAISDLLSVGNLLYLGTNNGLYSISIPDSSGTLVRVIDTSGSRVQSLAVRSNNNLYALLGVIGGSNVKIYEASGNIFNIVATQAPVTTPGLYYSLSFYNDFMYIITGSNIYKSTTTFCFNEGTKILYLNKHMKDKYIVVEKLKIGDFVKTFKHGYRKVSKIITGTFQNNPKNWNMCMYKMTKTETNGLLEDLIVTGGHSLLVDSISDVEQAEYDEMGLTDFSKITIDGKHLLLACVSEQFVPMQDNDVYTYYHLLLENNNDEEERFGIWANGILTETPNEKTLK